MNRRRKALAEALRIERREADTAWPEVEALAKIVYTPEMAAHDEWHDVVWAHADSWLLGYLGDVLVSVAGIHQREVDVNGTLQHVAGIGGVKTHPEHEKNGYSTAVLEATNTAIAEQVAPAFSLIFVEQHNRAFYEKRGWRVFDGTVMVEQHGEQVAFPERSVMLRDGASAAPQSGTIDMKGRPW